MTRSYLHTSFPHLDGSLRSYTIGFLLSIMLTLCAFWAASSGHPYAVVLIIALAVLQLGVQLMFFLHFGGGAAKSHQVIFALSFIIIVIVVGGTLWIMHNLQRLHLQPASMQDLYQDGTMAPQYELK